MYSIPVCSEDACLQHHRVIQLQLVSPHSWKMGWSAVVFLGSVLLWHSNLMAIGFLCLGLKNALFYA